MMLEKIYYDDVVGADAPTSKVLCDEMTKDMCDTYLWVTFYDHGYWVPRSIPDLSGDTIK